jgi:hypothetical protein
MEDLILSGMGVPLTPWTLVHGDKLVPLLDRIREQLPEELRAAQQVLAQREDMLTEAQQKAQQMVLDAQGQVDVLLSESELMRAVHAEADRVREMVTLELEALRKKTFEETEAMKALAIEESKAVREGAERYAESVLSSLDKSLGEFQQVIRNGQRYLKRTRTEASLPPVSRSASAQQYPQQRPNSRRREYQPLEV